MGLMKWDPMRDVDTVRNEMNTLLSGWPYKYFNGLGFMHPKVDIYETDDNVKIMAEIPGLESKDDVQVYVTEDSVQLKGEYKKSSDYDENNVYRSERFYGAFSRNISLPTEVRSDEAMASYDNGMLNITIPKSGKSSSKGRRIDIE